MSIDRTARRLSFGINSFNHIAQGADSPTVRLLRAAPNHRADVATPWLLEGPIGSGKTQIARLMARSLACHGSHSPLKDPCGDCGSCRAYAKFRRFNADWGAEFDCSNHSGSDLLDMCRYASLGELFLESHYHRAVILLDEFQALPTRDQAKFLKLIEDATAAHYILITSRFDAIDPALIDRCFVFPCRHLSHEELDAWLQRICAENDIRIEEDALALLVRECMGRPRAAIRMLTSARTVRDPITSDVIRNLLPSISEPTPGGPSHAA